MMTQVRMWTLAMLLLMPSLASAALPQFFDLNLQNAATSAVNGVAMPVSGYTSISVEVVISATATVTFQVSGPGLSGWVSRTCVLTSNTSGTLVTTATASGIYRCDVGGMVGFRASITSYGSGTVTVNARALVGDFGGGGGGGGGGTQYAEDAAHVSGDTGTVALSKRTDTAASSAGTDGDYATLNTDSTGRLWTNTEMPDAVQSTTTGQTAPTAPFVNAYIHCQDSGAVTVSPCIGSDNTAHDAVDAGNPLKIGAKASSATSSRTSVANNDRTNIYAGVDGILIVRPHANLEDRVSGLLANTDGASTAVVAAQGAGIRFCATTIIVSNSSATNVTVDIRDGTAGSVIATIPAAANMGGAVVQLPVPLCTTANTALAMDGSAAATTVTVTAIGFKTAL